MNWSCCSRRRPWARVNRACRGHHCAVVLKITYEGQTSYFYFFRRYGGYGRTDSGLRPIKKSDTTLGYCTILIGDLIHRLIIHWICSAHPSRHRYHHHPRVLLRLRRDHQVPIIIRLEAEDYLVHRTQHRHQKMKEELHPFHLLLAYYQLVSLQI